MIFISAVLNDHETVEVISHQIELMTQILNPTITRVYILRKKNKLQYYFVGCNPTNLVVKW